MSLLDIEMYFFHFLQFLTISPIKLPRQLLSGFVVIRSSHLRLPSLRVFRIRSFLAGFSLPKVPFAVLSLLCFSWNFSFRLCAEPSVFENLAVKMSSSQFRNHFLTRQNCLPFPRFTVSVTGHTYSVLVPFLTNPLLLHSTSHHCDGCQ